MAPGARGDPRPTPGHAAPRKVRRDRPGHDALVRDLRVARALPGVVRCGLLRRGDGPAGDGTPRPARRSGPGRHVARAPAARGLGALCLPPDPGRSARRRGVLPSIRSEEHTSELQSLMRISYAVFCLKKKNTDLTQLTSHDTIIYLHIIL